MAKESDSVCPLCNGKSIDDFFSDEKRDYLQCTQCGLVFVPDDQHLLPEEEKAHYDLHQNNPDDEGYRQFLNRLAEPLIAQLKPGMSGLDFGSGPGPTLSVMLEEAGFEMAIYDIFYADDDRSVLQGDYDFITTTEVVEHLSQPGEILEQLWARIKPGGWLGVMTKMVLDKEAFSRWHYKNDLTHISYFSRGTFDYLGQSWNASVQYPADDVVLMQKPSDDSD